MTAVTGERNGNWKGGRSVTAHGYVLVKRRDHPRADSRGYVYEHILVAEKMLGRALRPGEEVHHGPGGKADNRPENLTVCASRWEHRQLHAREPGRSRRPGEDNPSLPCACGCGLLLQTYDRWGRPRRFISGHNARVRGVMARHG